MEYTPLPQERIIRPVPELQRLLNDINTILDEERVFASRIAGSHAKTYIRTPIAPALALTIGIHYDADDQLRYLPAASMTTDALDPIIPIALRSAIDIHRLRAQEGLHHKPTVAWGSAARVLRDLEGDVNSVYLGLAQDAGWHGVFAQTQQDAWLVGLAEQDLKRFTLHSEGEAEERVAKGFADAGYRVRRKP